MNGANTTTEVEQLLRLTADRIRQSHFIIQEAREILETTLQRINDSNQAVHRCDVLLSRLSGNYPLKKVTPVSIAASEDAFLAVSAPAD